MGPTVPLRDVVGKGQDRLVVAVVPPHRDLDRDPLTFALDKDRLVDHRRLVAVEIADKLPHAAVIEELGLKRLLRPLIPQNDPHARVQERKLAQPVFKRLEAVVEIRERTGGRKKPNLGPFPAIRLTDDLQMPHRLATFKARDMLLAVPPDPQFQPVRKRIHDAYAHAMQTARHLIAVLVELTASMKLGHDDLGSADAFFRVKVNRNATSVVADRHALIPVDRHVHGIRMTGQSLVDPVVDDLVHHVVKARPVVRVPDIHTGALTNRL